MVFSIGAAESFSFLIRGSISERMRSVTSSSAMLIGYLTVERLSILVGLTPCTGPSETNQQLAWQALGLALLLVRPLAQVLPLCLL